MKRFGRPLMWAVVVLALAGAGYYAWLELRPPGLPQGFASGNGRIEATEIDVDTKIPGRIADIKVAEGDFVTAGQVLVHMDTKTLEAQRHEAEAQLERATIGVETAEAVVKEREAEQVAAKANIGVTQALLDAASARLTRVEPMAAKDFETKQALDDARAAFNGGTAAVAASQAKVAAGRGRDQRGEGAGHRRQSGGDRRPGDHRPHRRRHRQLEPQESAGRPGAIQGG